MKKIIQIVLLIVISLQSNAQLILNEVSSRNATLYKEDNKDYVDFIELYNTSTTPINLSSWYVTDNKNVPTKWQFFPASLAGNSYVTIFADKENSFAWYDSLQHTNFNINVDGDTIYLANSAGVIIDSLAMPKLEVNESVGKATTTITSPTVIFSTCTPKTANGSVYFSSLAGTPVISTSGGFFTSTINVSATCPIGQQAVYTTNSNTPNYTSPVLTGSIPISQTKVLKVRCKGAGMALGNMKTETYFINENTTLPVISLSTDSINLWDFYKGIWVGGPDSLLYQGANYYKGWRRYAKFEFFENGIKQFGKDVSINNDGGSSIVYPKHTLRINFNHTALGNNKLNYALFPNEKPSITSFKNIKLRNGGNVYGISYLNGGGGILYHDAIVQSFAKNLNKLGNAAYRPVIVYVNGAFWGLYEMRERQDEYFYATNYGAIEDSVKTYDRSGWAVDQYLRWDSIINYVHTATNNTSNAFYNNVNNYFDEYNVHDYFATETHFMNTDWQGAYQNNIKIWRDISVASDKKYRYTIYDFDYSFCNTYSENILNVLLNTAILSDQVKLFRSMMKNATYKKNFINRYADLINYYFQEDTVKNKYDLYNNQVQNEINRECARWTTNDPSQWQSKFTAIKNCVDTRNTTARQQIDSLMVNSSGQSTITISVQPTGAGKIKISTITPEPLPWSGIYFNGNELPVQAIANTGYAFDHWINAPTGVQTTNAFIDTFFTQNTNLIAVFKEVFAAGVKEVPLHSYSVYPNPVVNELHITYKNPSNAIHTICIKDILGKTMYSKQTKTSEIIPTNTYASGIYIVEITTATNKENYSFVKK